MTPEPKRAGVGQVVKAVLFALLMIGKKDGKTEDGATVTVAQVFVGAVIGFIVLIVALVLLVNFIAR